MEGGPLLLLVALLGQTASGQTVLRPAQTVQTASAQTVQASAQTASELTASSARAVDQQREGSDGAAPPSRAAELGGYWSNVCSTTDRPIGGEYIVIPGQNSFQSCYRQRVALTPRHSSVACHPITDGDICTEYTQVATLRSAADQEAAGALVDYWGTPDENGGVGGFIGWRNDVNRDSGASNTGSDRSPEPGWHWTVSWLRAGHSAVKFADFRIADYMYADPQHPPFNYLPQYKPNHPEGNRGRWPVYVHWALLERSGLVATVPETHWWPGPNCLCERYSRDACGMDPLVLTAIILGSVAGVVILVVAVWLWKTGFCKGQKQPRPLHRTGPTSRCKVRPRQLAPWSHEPWCRRSTVCRCRCHKPAPSSIR